MSKPNITLRRLSYTVEACPPGTYGTIYMAIQDAVRAIAGNAEMIGDQKPTQKPHGRLAWSFHMGGGPASALTELLSCRGARWNAVTGKRLSKDF